MFTVQIGFQYDLCKNKLQFSYFYKVVDLMNLFAGLINRQMFYLRRIFEFFDN